MPAVLPQESGLTVGGVVYRYTAVKKPQDQMLVHVQNENALASGYIFRSTDDWSKLPGNTINKIVPVNNIPIQYWGNGSIAVEGSGAVTNPYVSYSYTYDTCYNPIKDPRCPGYDKAMYDWLLANGLLKETKVSDSTLDDFLNESLKNKGKTEEEKQEESHKEKDKKDTRQEIAKQAIKNTLLTAEAVAQNNMIQAMDNVPNFSTYYTSIPGGVYKDALNFEQKKLPENRLGLRVGLAQQILHNKMVEAQYKTKIGD
jgi:hypothetical protein